MTRDRVGIVTGASSGIGRAIALRLGKKGMRVALFARRENLLREVAAQIEKSGGEPIVVAGDATREKDVGGCVEKVVHAWGRIDILINNAGIGGFRGPVDQAPVENWEKVFATNVRGPFLFTRAVVPHMKRTKRGQIVNMGSIVGFLGAANMLAYSTSKWALRGFNECLREELYPHGIKVALVAPGMVITEFGGRSGESATADLEEWAMTPDDIADVVERIVDQGPNADIKEVVVQVRDRS